METRQPYIMKDTETDNISEDSFSLLEDDNLIKKRSSTNEDAIDFENSRAFFTDLPSKESLTKKTESTQIYDFDDSDEDTFADAESDCEPNHFFLQEMLEDEHPERLSLFDYRKKEQEKENSSRTLSSSDTHDEVVVEDSSTSGHDVSGTGRLIRNLNIDSDSESEKEESDDKDDSVSNLPTIKKRGSRGRLSMGTSPSVGPGRSMLRQASRKTVWGK